MTPPAGPLVAYLRRENPFYRRLYRHLPPDFAPEFGSPDWSLLPLITKADLAGDQRDSPPFGLNASLHDREYVRVHQTSGTSTGRPLRWRDTNASWHWLRSRWLAGFEMMGVGRDDRIFFAFSFGPFLGFWTSFEAATSQGWPVIAGGGMTTQARLLAIVEHRATVVCCTPTYAMRLLEVAGQEGIDLGASDVRALVVAGEPGGSVAGTRQKLESGFGARVFDHYGLTEVGVCAFERLGRPGSLEMVEGYYVECLDPDTLQPVPDGAEGELVLSSPLRTCSPLLRYRTGDIVRLRREGEACLFDGGILGRADDMIHVRGNNVYPSTVEAVVRRFPEAGEFRIILDETGPMAELSLEVEPADASVDAHALAARVAQAVREQLLFRVEVAAVPPGTLPRFEMKAKRLIRKTKEG
jgi:phenylacetate-CoA ligase